MATLTDLGERRAVQILLRTFDRGHIPGLGDDCGIIPFGDQYILLTTDVVYEKTHFPGGATPYDMGWYSVAVNLSDVAAMGGYPIAFVAALLLPRTTDVSFLQEIARGMDNCAKQFGMAVYGGDTKEGDSIAISGVAMGRVPRDKILLRLGCKPGDIVAVTGDIGRGAWAIEMIKHGGPNREALEALLHPIPRLEAGWTLSESGAVTSCIDNSDGLATTLHQIATANSMGFEIEESKLPIFGKLKLMTGQESTKSALYKGGDYELVVTLKPEAFESVQASLARRNLKLNMIGHVTKERGCLLVTSKGKEAIPDQGWEHFKVRTS